MFFWENLRINLKNISNHKNLRQTARENIKIDDKHSKKEFAEKMLNPFYYTDRALQVDLKITLDNHHIHHSLSKLSNKPNYKELALKTGILGKK